MDLKQHLSDMNAVAKKLGVQNFINENTGMELSNTTADEDGNLNGIGAGTFLSYKRNPKIIVMLMYPLDAAGANYQAVLVNGGVDEIMMEVGEFVTIPESDIHEYYTVVQLDPDEAAKWRRLADFKPTTSKQRQQAVKTFNDFQLNEQAAKMNNILKRI